jgi:tetratricopeptide (TPR) repeat protein
MSRPKKFDREMPETSEAFVERIDLLFEELSFAIQWKRPSILLVFYESENIRDKAELALEERLTEIGQRLVQVKVDKKTFDIPLLLSRRPERDQSVYSVNGLSSGGGKAGANAYRALNMRREYFVDYSIRVIIWLAGNEAIELSRHAPDFWAFRHRVVELYDSMDTEDRKEPINELAEGGQRSSAQPGDVDRQIEKYEALISELPKKAESYPKRLELLLVLASLYRAKQAYDQSIQRSRQGILIARKINNIAMLVEFWMNLGAAYVDLDQKTKAIRACRKALRLSPKDARLWGKVGHLYHIMKRFRDAIIAYQQVILLDPQNSSARSALVACYRLLGKAALAESWRTKPNIIGPFSSLSVETRARP